MTSSEILKNTPLANKTPEKKYNDVLLEDHHHVVRYLYPTWWKKKTNELSTRAFALRPKDEGFVSCNWFEYHNDMEKVKQDIKLDKDPEGKYAYLAVKEIKEVGAQSGLDLSVKWVSFTDSHSGIFNIDNNIDFLTDMAAFVTRKLREQQENS